MSRRILLIDADTEFRATLTKHLGRYRVVVTPEPDPDRALAQVAADAPDLVIIAVEEPDKAGFKTFQKARKSIPAKLPIVLVTKSMSKDSFAKHRGLKVHADEYLDKRSLTKDELIGKLDNLMGLGDLQEDDESIAVEDEIPMEIADGDVVLDEHLDDPENEFAANPHEMATVGGNNARIVDQMVSQELDGAFDSMLAEDVRLPSVAASIPEPVERVNASAMEVPTEAAIDSIPEPVPEPVGDDGVPESAAADDDSGIPEPVPHKIPDDDDGDGEKPVSQSEWDAESIPAPIMDGGRSTGSFEPINASDEPNVDDLPAAPRAEAPLAAAADEEPLAPVVVDDELGEDDLVSLDDDAIEEVEEEVPESAVEASSPAPEPAPPVQEPSVVIAEHARAKRPTGSQASIDLGLDKLAQDAESEQSGVYDRKSLRKIGELERQISQLKTELERARIDAEKALKGGNRESQFLNLRESNLAKEKELKQVKTTLEQTSRELAEAQELLRQTQQAKSALDAKHAELQKEQAEDSAKVKELAASLREATAQASQLEQELELKTKAATSAEAKVLQLEKDLANERATGAASASEAEKKLRTERDQMLIRHKGELAAAKAEVEAQQELVMGRMREELEAERAAAVEEAIEETRKANAAEHAQIVAKLEAQHNAERLELTSTHAGELSRVKNELGGEIERLKGELAEAQASHVVAIAAANDEREAALQVARRERDDAVEAAERERDTGIAEAHRKRETAVAFVEAAKASALAEQAQAHAQAMEQLKAQHAADIEAREEEHQDVLARDAQSHGQALSQLKQELDRTVASYETKLSAARNDNEVLKGRHAEEKVQLEQAHEAAIAKLKAEQDEEEALLTDGHRRAVEKLRQELADQQAKYERQIAELQENSSREIAELAAQLQAAKRAADEAAARHAAETQELLRQHAERIDELEATHERAIAVANGEHLKAKAVADAEHKQAIAALKAEADRMLKQLDEERTRAINELTAEREELRRGLAGSRDSLKQSQGELASAVQTIADRNADLRAHAQAIAERDQRIAQLRAEYEQLEQENANYQEQVLRAYQKIKSDEAMVARARKAMAIALTVLDDEGNPQSSSS